MNDDQSQHAEVTIPTTTDEHRWGEPITEPRQAELDGCLKRWAAKEEAEHGARGGPFAGIALTAADVFYLAARSLAGLQTDRGALAAAAARLHSARDNDILRLTMDLPALHLEGANLREAHLEHASLGGAHLEGASLDGAHLDGASLSGTHLEGASFDGAQLVGASLGGAELQRASLDGAHLEGALLGGTDLTQASLGGADLKHASLGGARLEGAFLEQAHLEHASLRGANLKHASLGGAHLDGASLEEAYLESTDLVEAHLERANLDRAHLKDARLYQALLHHASLRGAHLERASLEEAHLEHASLAEAHLEEGRLGRAHMEYAILTAAHLERASFGSADLRHADLEGAHLEGASLHGAHLEGANLARAHLGGKQDGAPAGGFPPTDLRLAFLDSATVLDGITLGDAQQGYTSVADVRWGGANLAVVSWPANLTRPTLVLGDEREARASKDAAGKRKGRTLRLQQFSAAARANRQLAVALQDQGMNEEAARFSSRAQLLQQQVAWRQRKFGTYLFSRFLDGLAGYGYKPLRAVIAYTLVLAAFALGYYFATRGQLTFGLQPSQFAPLPWYEALVLSISSFHGRGFFQPVESLGDPVAILAAAEAIIGLLIEISFIATFTQRFFGSR